MLFLWPHESFCGQELSWADTGSEACDQQPDGSPSWQYKSRPTKNLVNRGTKKTPAPPSPVTNKWIQELLLPQARMALSSEPSRKWGSGHPRRRRQLRWWHPRRLGLRLRLRRWGSSGGDYLFLINLCPLLMCSSCLFVELVMD
jgi:hypothetical protein